MSGDKGKLPRFIDNQDGNTMARAIRDSLKRLRQQKKSPTELQIASAYFNPQGLQLIAKEAEHLPSIRLLLGAEPEPEIKRQRRLPGDDHDWMEQQVKKTILSLDQALRKSRNNLSFDIETDQAVKTLLDFLTSNKIVTRRYTSRFLHAKTFLFLGSEEQLLTGSSNLTRAGLQGNLELNLAIHDPDLLGEIKNWYQDLWEDAEPFDLAAIYQELFAEYSPYEIYLMVLWQLYGEEITQEADEDESIIKLSRFQQHGVKRALRILEKYHGVMIADGVGLGKTYLALAVINEFTERRERVLVICPAALCGMWEKILNEYQIFSEVVSMNKFRDDKQFGGEHQYLKRDIEEFALIVIDEAHNYRTPDTDNAKALRELLRQRKKLVLLTATPVNNGIMDLYVLFSYFLKQDAVLSDEGIISLTEKFKLSASTEPDELNPDTLFPIIDATTVKRPRSFIKEYYTGDTIEGLNGEEITISFPKPCPEKVTYQLEELNPDFFEELKTILMPEVGDPKLTLARYKAENYLLGKKRTLRFRYVREGQKKHTSFDVNIDDDTDFLFEQADDNPLGIVVESVFPRHKGS